MCWSRLPEAIAAAHDIGVLHKDLKPANVLVTAGREDDSERGNGNSHALHWQIKVADFGSGALADPTRLGALGITNLGFTETVTPDSILTGTLAYLAPEVLAGHSPTISSDVYALGVMLYQLIVGDFRKPLSPGWEAGIDDPLLREDIAEAACGDPALRLKSAAELVERLETLEARRVVRSKVELAEQRAQVAERTLAGLESAAAVDHGCCCCAACRSRQACSLPARDPAAPTSRTGRLRLRKQ